MERGVKTRLREISDQSGWDYDYKGDWYRFSKLSPEGQDFNIEIEASDLDMFKTELENFHDNNKP